MQHDIEKERLTNDGMLIILTNYLTPRGRKLMNQSNNK
jgi:hypothetical protein